MLLPLRFPIPFSQSVASIALSLLLLSLTFCLVVCTLTPLPFSASFIVGASSLFAEKTDMLALAVLSEPTQKARLPPKDADGLKGTEITDNRTKR